MRQHDVELPASPEWTPDAPCLLSGGPASLQTVTLRRMLLLGVLWVGEDATIDLPLAKPLLLAPWQYLRMLRPVLGLGMTFPLMLELEARLAGGWPRLAVLVAGVLAVWFPIEWLLRRQEPVRLLGISRDRRRLRVRFTDPRATDRALGALVGGASGTSVAPPTWT